MEEKDINKATVLVVDDNPNNLNLLSDCLTDSGFTVLLKKDGEKALALTQRKLPDIILLDIIMPGLDGFETCKRFKADPATKNIPIIFMTALSETVDKVKGFELGAVDYITKPFHHEEVLARVKAHLTIQNLKKNLEEKNLCLQESLERERKLVEDIRLNLSLSLPHELRTPLNAVLGFSSFLTKAGQLPEAEKIAEYGEAIHKNGWRLNRLIENSLLYAHLKLLKYTSKDKNGWQQERTINACTVIPEITRQIAAERERSEDLELELTNAGIRISEDNLKKILTEILDNAFKFSLPGTPVRVKLMPDTCLCILSISDKGRGMSREQISSIGAYMQFERKQQEQQGSGLGLIIAYLLARLEGGILSVTGEPGKGTNVSLVLKCDTGIIGTEADSGSCETEKCTGGGRSRICYIIPPESEMKKLREMISIGDVKGIINEINRIDIENSRCRNFTDRVRQLTGSFQMNRLRDFVNQHSLPE